MNGTENPYSPPRATIDSVQGGSKIKPLTYAVILAAIVIRVGFRFFGSLATTFLVMIEFKGLGVNWSNALPLLLVLWAGCIASHFILKLRTTSNRINYITGWPLYFAGIFVAIFIVTNELHPKGF